MTEPRFDGPVTGGFRPEDRDEVSALIWTAFAGKLGRVLGPRSRAVRFLARALDPDFALCARDAAGRVIGVAGFKTDRGGFIGGTDEDLCAVYGAFGALWRGPLLALFERDTETGTLLMDGICVDAGWRGRGVGCALLRAIEAEAAARGCTGVRLDVVDTNPDARRLYLRTGYRPAKTEQMGALHLILGFRSATTMIRTLPTTPPK